MKTFSSARLWVALATVSVTSEFAVVAADLASIAPAPTHRTGRVLVVTGVDYPGHHWRETALALKTLLEADPRLQVTITEDPARLASETLEGWDTVLLHFMNWEQPAPGEAARNNLRRYVEGGKGLMLVHFACGAWQDWTEFVKLAGRVWDPKRRPHDPYGAFRVEITDPIHPVTAGLSGFETKDELYTCLTGETPIHVLATAKSKVDGAQYPMAFVLSYGTGRVFHTVLGHDVQALTNSAVAELVRRGCAWSAGLAPIGEGKSDR